MVVDGSFILFGYECECFIFIIIFLGYKIFNCYYYKIEKKQFGYDFGLIFYSGWICKDGFYRYIYIIDIEIFNMENYVDWVNNVYDYVRNEQVVFIIYIGDFCYEKGLKVYIKLMNMENMDCFVFYCIGNYDLVKGKYGEEFFESIYGLVYYFFDVGNVYYVVMLMFGGDYVLGYIFDDVCCWLKNDLVYICFGIFVVVFNYDLLIYEDIFIFKSKNVGSINLNEYNLKVWVYGYWYINYMKKQGDVYSVCIFLLDKGGIDYFIIVFCVMYVDSKGDFIFEFCYIYLDKNICIVLFVGVMVLGVFLVVVNVYFFVLLVREVFYICLVDGKFVLKNK